MSVLPQLASSQKRKDEEPNIKLAEVIVASNNKAAIKELIHCLHHKNKGIRHDCIKVLYEIGNRKPVLIAAYAEKFLELLTSTDNRMAWGAMAALDAIALEKPQVLYKKIKQIEASALKGSVITRDHAVGIFIKLCSIGSYAEEMFNLLLLQLNTCPVNQLPMYAERSLPVLTGKQKVAFAEALHRRIPELEKKSQEARLRKVIKKTGYP